MPSDRYAPYSLPTQLSQSEYRKVNDQAMSEYICSYQIFFLDRMLNQLWKNDDEKELIEV